MNDEPSDAAPESPAFPDPDGNGLTHDPILLEAEGRARGAEFRAAALEGEVASIRERSAMMDEQFEQLRVQLQALSGAVVASPQMSDSDQNEYDEGMFGAHTPVWVDGGPTVEAPAWDGSSEPSAPAWEDHVISEPSPPTWQDRVISEPSPPTSEERPEPEPAPVSRYEVRAEPEPAQAAPPEAAPIAEAPLPRATETPPSSEPSSSLFQISPDPTVLAAEQIAGLLQAAQQAAKRIVDTAQDRVQTQLAEMDRQRRKLDSDTRELATWRNQVRSLVDSLISDVDAFRSGLGEIPHRLSQAFSPLAGRIPALQKEMADLIGALGSASSLFPMPGVPEGRQGTQGDTAAQH